MPNKPIYTEIEGRKLKLTNLDKILYPSIRVSKAEIIQYYLQISEYMSPFLVGRPLTLIRFPDGIDKHAFYSKKKASWTPTWIDSIDIKHSEESIEYIIANEKATLVFLANLAALEIHPMQMIKTRMEFPDHFIFDLDPPENGDFQLVKEIAFKLNDFLKSYNYKSFVKTSGSKGLHLYIPIQANYTHEVVVESVKSLAKNFVAQNKDLCTLALNKSKRSGKTLIDILRNHETHTTIAPFSLRAKPKAPISFPISWQTLKSIKSAREINIKNYQEYLSEHGYAWTDMFVDPPILHDSTSEINSQLKEKLALYSSKRNFNNSPEPPVLAGPSPGNRFCIQLHNASNLHYDLRLESEGVLLSWAIPKGLPIDKNQKRLAIQTEDHPTHYLTFEGIIPKGEYGAGQMWVFTSGTFEWKEKGKSSYIFELKSASFNRTYSMVKMQKNQWLIQLVENRDFDTIEKIQPMLASMGTTIPKDSSFHFEIKWDGIRAMIYLDGEKITILSRSGRDISNQFPELQDSSIFEVESGIFDAEIVHLDTQGKPQFSNVISRLHLSGESSIKKATTTNPATCYLFDCLYLDGKHITKEPQERRYQYLQTVIKSNTLYRVSEALNDGFGLFEAIKKMGMEGIMVKNKKAPYLPGTRSTHWSKIKVRHRAICFIAGYTRGKGDRSSLFGALHLLSAEDENQPYMGKVGTGFDAIKMKNLIKLFADYLSNNKLFIQKTADDHQSIWLRPELKCEIEYASFASTGFYREPVFIKLITP